MNWVRNTESGNSKWWSWWLGIVVILVFYLVLGSIPAVIGTMNGLINLEPGGSMMSGSANPVQFVLLMCSPLMLFVGVWVAQRVIHRRSLSALLSADGFRWPFVWNGMALWLILGVVSTGIESLLYPGRYSWTFDFSKWIVIAPLVLLLIPIQAAGEELFFRGYLLQAIARLRAHPILLVFASGILFMLPHLSNPEMSNALGGQIPMALNYFLMGVGLAWVSLRDNGIERAIGIHVVNNVYAGIAVGYANSVLSTPTFFEANVIDGWLGVGTLVCSFAIILLMNRSVPRV
jgi:membrane protease YdiL (CAAX protease family)